jgi:hypothetical protein
VTELPPRPLVMDGIEVNMEDPVERDIIWRYTQVWQGMPRRRQTDQGWCDLVLSARMELARHRGEVRMGRGAVGPP